MKAQIQQVLEMNKSGTLTAEQAAELIEALSQRASAPPRVPPAKVKGFAASLLESIAGPMRDATHAPWRSSDLQGVYASDLRDNDTRMSRVELQESRDYTFQGNGIRMSSLQLTLQRGVFVGNAVSASQVEGIAVRDGSVRGCAFNGSSVESSEVSDSDLAELQVTGSQVTQLALTGRSRMQRVKIAGTELKGLRLSQESAWTGVQLNGCQVAELDSDASALDDVEIDASQLRRVQLVRSQLRASVLRGARLIDVKVVGSRLDNLLITGGDGWRKRGLQGVEFHDCDLEQVLLADCRWQNVVVRNVRLREVQARRVNLSDVVIDGNEAFLQAISAKN
ncbi:MAG: pentapeptide repeat-containing protein [Deltaproteobacteria bacterium]|nr:pentapeptide repeat-containing protein [Deltaproteobacteria bacterium]